MLSSVLHDGNRAVQLKANEVIIIFFIEFRIGFIQKKEKYIFGFQTIEYLIENLLQVYEGHLVNS